MERRDYALKPEQLRRVCDGSAFAFETTAEVDATASILGQSRAVRAMDFGLRISRPGYNIFMVGHSGTGRTTYAKKAVREKAQEQVIPPDWCYVYNFADPSQPQALALAGGKGREFKNDVEELEKTLREEIPKAFDGNDYERQKATILKGFQQVRAQLLEKLTDKAKQRGFALKTTKSGFLTVPIVDGKEVAQKEYSDLEPAKQREIEESSRELRVEAAEIMRQVGQEERRAKEKIRELDQSIGLSVAGHLIEDLKQKYSENTRVTEYLEAFKGDVLENLDQFKTMEEDEQQQLAIALLAKRRRGNNRYRVNLLVDNSQGTGSPVVVETNPTWYNLLGRVEYQNEMGSFVTDFTRIKSGAFHRANGGYLIIQAMDLLANPLSWQALKRVLKNREIRVESIGDQHSSLALSTLRPEPIPVSMKVVLIGNPRLYHILYTLDEDFKKLFKVKVDFSDDMSRNGETEEQLARFIAGQCNREGLCHFHRDAVARAVEYSSRLADSQRRLSTHFNELGELVFEAAAWAEADGSATVRDVDVQRAIDEKIARSNRVQEYRERIVAEGKLLLATEGKTVGQLNGLSVLSTGDYRFGVPTRITANTFVGRGGIINIEREIQLSGQIHSKGVLTLAGYLGERFARRKPLALSASITFEQLYGGIEGDSASSAELFSLISSLAEIPLDQSIAVTGSVNQKGEIQPVGGVNEKIEGYYDACKLQGLTGSQGVIIPASNKSDLMLKADVVEAVDRGDFHVYAIEKVEQGLELLTGIPAGAIDQAGEYPRESIFGKVQHRLAQFYQAQQRKSAGDE